MSKITYLQYLKLNSFDEYIIGVSEEFEIIGWCQYTIV